MFRLLLILILAAPLIQTLAADNSFTGTLLVANRNGGSVSMYDLPTRTEIARLPIGPVIPHEMAASPDGRWAVTSEYGTGGNPGRHVIVIDVPAAEIVSRIDLGPNSRPHSLWFLQDSRHLVATLENSDRLALIDIQDETVVRTWPTGGRESHMVRLAPDDSRAYVASRGDGTMSVIDLNNDRAPTVMPTGSRAEGIGVSPDGSEVWIANQGESTISIIDTRSLEIIDTIGGIATNRIEFLPDGTAVIPGGSSADGSVRYVTFYDGETKQATRRLELPGSTAFGTGVRLLSAGEALFLADSAINEVSVLSRASSLSREVIDNNPDNIDGMAWSPLRLNIMSGR